jgi:REP element-mobilizing transposase RayT
MSSDLPNRQSIRLRHHDYAAPGAYFVTINTKRGKHLFGEIVDGIMRLNEMGWIVDRVWNGLPDHYPWIRLDEFIVMPNHIHFIVVILDPDRRARLNRAPPTPIFYHHTLGQIIHSIKSFSTREINAMRHSPGTPRWHRNYFERIIRDDAALNRIRKYIRENPMRWEIKYGPRSSHGRD